MVEYFAILDMSSKEPHIQIIRGNVVEKEYTVAREYCMREAVFHKLGLPAEIEALLCIAPEQDTCKDIFARWENTLCTPLAPEEVLLKVITRHSENHIPVYTLDKGSIVILGMAEEYRAISYRTGILLIYAGEYRSFIISMYEGRIYSAFGFCSALIERDELCDVLEQFKNKWLPDEEIQAMGGCGSIFVSDIPEEAIFSASYCIGGKIKKYEGIAQCLPYALCNGFIHKSAYHIMNVD